MEQSKNPPRQKQKPRRNKGLSLVELMAAMAVLAAITLLVLPAFSFRQSSPKATAGQFLETLELAQKYSQKHGIRTRVVFSSQEINIENAYAIYTFYIPPTDDSTRTFDLLGKWIPFDPSPEWRKIPDPISYTTLDNQDLSALYYNPPQFWDSNATNYLSSTHSSSPFFTNYYQTPYLENNYNLSGVEFDSQGMPTFQQSNEMVIRFADKKNTNNAWGVHINRSTGQVTLQ